MASPSESDDPAAAAAASSRERQEQQHPVPPTLNDQDDDDEDDDEENALPGMWMEGDSLGTCVCVSRLSPCCRTPSFTRPNPPSHTQPTAAPPCQSDLDIVPEVVSLAQVTAQDVRAYVLICVCERAMEPNRPVVRIHTSPTFYIKQVLFDLGCGDGRVCIEAAKATGARGVGECWLAGWCWLVLTGTGTVD